MFLLEKVEQPASEPPTARIPPMELLTTHLGADFDAFASVMLARRLHPEARVLFPGSKEESVRRLLEGPFGREVPFEEVKQKEVEPAELTRVILCDVLQPDRIGVVARWLEENPGIELWAYDHHDPAEDDLRPAGGRVDSDAGSTATILVELLAERGFDLTPAEATLLLLGLYEDTGSLA